MAIRLRVNRFKHNRTTFVHLMIILTGLSVNMKHAKMFPCHMIYLMSQRGAAFVIKMWSFVINTISFLKNQYMLITFYDTHK